MSITQNDRATANAILFGLSRRTCGIDHAISHAQEVVRLMKVIKKNEEDPKYMNVKWVGDSDERRAKLSPNDGKPPFVYAANIVRREIGNLEKSAPRGMLERMSRIVDELEAIEESI